MLKPNRRRKRRLGGLTAAGCTLAVLLLPVGVRPSQAQSETAVFEVAGSAAGLGILYNRAAVLPLDPIADAAIPRASAALNSTPAASSLAAPLDPGALRTAPGAVSSLGGLPFSLPSVPGAAVAEYPTGPSRSEVVPESGGPADAVAATAVAEEHRARGFATLGSAEGPPTEGETSAVTWPASAADQERVASLRGQLGRHLFGVADMSAAAEDDDLLFAAKGLSTEAVVTRGDAMVSASFVSNISEVSLLGGIITIAGVHGEISLTWPDDQGQPTINHVTEIGAVTVLGVPAKITKDGIVLASSSIALPVADTVNELIKARGGVFAVDDIKAASGSHRVVPLIFEFEGEIQPGEIDRLRLTFGLTTANYTRDQISFGGASQDFSEAPSTPSADASVEPFAAGDGDVALPTLKTPTRNVALPDSSVSPPGPQAGGPTTPVVSTDVAAIVAAAVKRPPLVGFVVVVGAISWFFILLAGRFGLFLPTNVEGRP